MDCFSPEAGFTSPLCRGQLSCWPARQTGKSSSATGSPRPLHHVLDKFGPFTVVQEPQALVHNPAFGQGTGVQDLAVCSSLGVGPRDPLDDPELIPAHGLGTLHAVQDRGPQPAST